MKTKRLLTLADFLEKKLPPRKLDMTCFMRATRQSTKVPKVVKQVRGAEKGVVMPIHCKTSGCAFGWAATIPEFRRDGLQLFHMEYLGDDALEVHYKGKVDFEAAEKFFDMSERDVNSLFGAGQFTPKEVAKRIRLFVKLRNMDRVEDLEGELELAE